MGRALAVLAHSAAVCTHTHAAQAATLPRSACSACSPHPTLPHLTPTHTPTHREIGITRNDNIIPTHKLEHHIRADLDASSSRALAVLRPLRCVITNLPDDHVELVDAKHFPGRDDSAYKVPFSKVGGGRGWSREESWGSGGGRC